MAEAFLNMLGGTAFEAESAGIEPGVLNPTVVEVMRESGIDISKNQTKDVFDFLKQGKLFHTVITVCDEASGERCPVFPGVAQRLNWSFADPSSFTGTPAEKIIKTREVRDQIEARVRAFLEEVSSS